MRNLAQGIMARHIVWSVTAIDDECYCAENGESTRYIRGSHCKACALVKLLTEFGGDVDLRGLSSYGICYQMLAVTVRAVRGRKYELEIDPDANLSIAEQSEA